MALLDLVPMLTVPDVAAAVAFYTGTLGFRCANQMEGWAVVELDSVPDRSESPKEAAAVNKRYLEQAIGAHIS